MRAVFACLVFALAVAGCGEPDVVLREGTAPETATATAARATTFGEVVADQPTVPDEQASTYVGIAADGDGLAAARARFLVDAPIEADMDRDVLLFLGFGDSGSCPFEFRGLVLDGTTLDFALGPEDGTRTCTADYNQRTLVIRVGRDRLPEGPFDLVAPLAEFPTTVLVDPVPAPREPVIKATGDIHDVSLAAAPREVTPDGAVSMVLASPGPAVVDASGPADLESWDGRQWLPTPPTVPPRADVYLRVLAGEQAELLTLDVGTLGLAPGAYRVLVRVGTTTRPMEASEPSTMSTARLAAHFDVIDPGAGNGSDGAAPP